MGQPRVSDDEHGTRWITIDRPDLANALYLADPATTGAIAAYQRQYRRGRRESPSG